VAAWRKLAGAAAAGPFIGSATRAPGHGQRCLGIRTTAGHVAGIHGRCRARMPKSGMSVERESGGGVVLGWEQER
jgi:hypothetical protein